MTEPESTPFINQVETSRKQLENKKVQQAFNKKRHGPTTLVRHHIFHVILMSTAKGQKVPFKSPSYILHPSFLIHACSIRCK